MNNLEERKNNWLNENSPRANLMGNCILPMNPEIGQYLTVNDFKISQDFFTEEFNQISKAYYSVLDKMSKFNREKYPTKPTTFILDTTTNNK